MNTNEPRIIKKYPNRRLYDTAISRYITLKDVKNLVKQHVTFHIQDAKTGEDITHSIFLQIILEQEEKGEPIFTSEMLAQLIRFYGDTLQSTIANYFVICSWLRFVLSITSKPNWRNTFAKSLASCTGFFKR
jgi:polyhydroxyalkanoate synthesis repressor PhaR